MTTIKNEQEATSKERPVYSRPVFRQTLAVNSLEAQRVMARTFERLKHALLALDVLLRIKGRQSDIDPLEKLVNQYMAEVQQDMDKAASQFTRDMEDNGIQTLPVYTHPVCYAIELNSPQCVEFLALVRKLDGLMGQIDTLWLSRILTSQERLTINYQWQQRLVQLVNQICELERRAREMVYGKTDQAQGVQTSLPDLASATDKEPQDKEETHS